MFMGDRRGFNAYDYFEYNIEKLTLRVYIHERKIQNNLICIYNKMDVEIIIKEKRKKKKEKNQDQKMRNELKTWGM